MIPIIYSDRAKEEIERLLDLSISDVETQLQLRIAFKLDLIR